MDELILEARKRRMKAHLQVRSEWQNLDYLRVAMEHATEEARKKYLKDHPNADPKNHTVQKSPGLKSGPSESRVKKFLQSANTVMRKAWESSSDSVKRFVSDPVERKKMARDMTKAALSFGPKASKKFGQMLAGEAKAIANDTPAILAAAAGVTRSVKVERTDKKGKKETIWVAEGLLKPDGKGSYTSDDPRYEVVLDEDGIPEYQTKPRMLNKQEMYTVYGVGVYAAGIALSFSGATPLLAGVAATKAFGHSITLHAGFKAMSGLLDDVFLGAEAAESVALAKGLDAGVNTGQIPGLNTIWDAISETVVKISAEEKAPKLDDSQKFLHDFMMKVYTETAKSFENLSDKDMEAIMKHGVAPQGSSPKGKTADMSEQASLALMKMLSRLTRKLGVSDHVYIVGGAVRNFVIDQPIKDIDVVIDSLALGKDSEWLANQVAREIPATTEVVTDQYGVSKVFVLSSWMLAGHEMMDPAQAAVEIANARKESYGGAAGKGYKPDQVDPATIEEDVLRREFTFNTLMWRLTDVAQGPDKAEIIDLTGCGLRDLKDRSMKCPSDPDTTFSDDPSRMLRAVKFIMKYGMKLTPDTEAAIRRNIRKLRNAPYEAVAVILEDTLLKDKATAKKALPEMKRLGLLDEIADWIRSSKPFRSRMEGWVNSKPMLYLFDLMEVGLPLGANLSFLDRKEQTRLRQIALGMQDKEAKHLLAVLRQIGKAMDTSALIREFGLVKKAIGDMQRNVARPLVLEDPSLAWDSKKLTDAVRQELRRRKTAGSPLVQLNINLGEGEAIQKIIPSNSVPYLLDNVKVEQVQKVAAAYVQRRFKQGSGNSPKSVRLANAKERLRHPRHVEMLAHVWNWGSPLISRPAYGQFYTEDVEEAASRVAAKYKNKKQVDKADGSGKTTVYEYTKGQVDHRNREKAKKVEKLRGQLGDLQAQVKKDLKSSDEKTRNLALVVGLINDTYERVGNDGSAEDGHFGVTGWQAQHVSVSGGKAHFTYVGKSGVKQKKTTSDASLVKAVEAALQGKSGEDALFSVGPQDVNEYLKPFGITAKDIRGLHANRVMQGHLKDLRAKGGKLPEDKKERDDKLKDEFDKALEATAGDVGHEAATLRGQYLVPGLEDNYLKDGSIVDNLAKQATKSQAEKDDEQAERMSRPAPSNKPPRKDLRRNRVEVDDKDVESQGADNDRDLSLNYKRVARGIYAEAIQRVLDQQLRSLVAGKIPKDAPEKKPGDYWESNNGWRAIAPDAKDGKSSPAKDEESAKAIATGKSKPEKTPDEQKAEAEEEAKAKEKAKAQAKAEAKRRAKSFDNQVSTMLEQMPEGLASAVKKGLPEKGSKEYQQLVNAYSESVEFFIESEDTRQMSGLVSKAFKALKLYEDTGSKGKGDKGDKGDKDDTGDKSPLEGMTPDRMGEFIAAAHYATEVAANPTIIGGRKLNGAKEPAELIERGSEAAREFASASPEIRKVAALKAAKVLAEMPMDDPNRLEMEVIVDGLVVAAAANGEDLPEQLDRPHMSKGSKALCKYMVKNGTEDMLLGSFDDYYGPKGRAAVGEALSHMKDEELADVSEDTGWGPLAEKLKDKNVSEEQKEWIRQWLREQGVEDMTTTQEVLEIAAKQSSVNQAEMEEKFAKDIAGTEEHKDWLRKLVNPPKGTTFADLNVEYQTWRSQYYLDWLKAQDIELPVTHPVIARHQHVVSTGDTSIRDEKLFTPAPEKTLDQKKQDYLQNAENLSPEDRQRVLSMPAQDFEAMMSAVSEEDESSDETFKQAKFCRS